MLFDGIKLLSGSVAQNLNIKTGLTFPTGTEGELFYIKEGAAFTEGLYVYDGAAWNLTNNVLTTLEITTALGYTPLSSNQPITVSGDASGSGTTSIALTLAASGVTAGTYNSVSVDAKGRVTSGSNPTTLSGHGITDAYTKTAADTLLAAKANNATTLSGYGITDSYTKTAADALLATKANNATTLSGYGITDSYTKTAADALLATKANNASTLSGYGITDAYTKIAADALLATKANNASTLSGYGITDAYTKAATDIIIATKANNASTLSGYGITDAYTKAATDTLLVAKANNATTLSGYGITDAYTKTAADALLAAKANNATTLSGYGITDAYTKAATDIIIATKANNATTLSGYGITDAYTKTTADALLATKANNATTLSGYGITDAQSLSGDLTSIAGLAGTTGFLKKTAVNTWALDTSTYLTSNQSISVSGDATGSGTTAIALTLAASGVTAGSGYNTFTVDTKGRVTSAGNAAYLLGNQSISVSGDATGSGTTAIALTLAASGVTAGTYGTATSAPTFTVDSKGRLTSASTIVITPAFSSITSKPTTLPGYGITDAVSINGSTMIGNLVISTGSKLTLADAPSIGTDAVNKNYVDAAITGLSWKNGVKALATTNITLSGLQTVDGVVLGANDRVLVSGQTDAKTNGIYVVSTGAWTRSLDTDTGAEIVGLGVWVNGGTIYGDTGWVCTNDTVVLGTDSILFVQFNGASGITAGVGLTKTGNTLSVGLGAGIAQLPSTEVGIDLYSGGGLMLTIDGTTSTTQSAAQLSLIASGVTAGTYGTATSAPTFTVDSKGRLTSASNIVITPAFSSITSKPTTLSGYGITDAMSSGQSIDGGTF